MILLISWNCRKTSALSSYVVNTTHRFKCHIYFSFIVQLLFFQQLSHMVWNNGVLPISCNIKYDDKAAVWILRKSFCFQLLLSKQIRYSNSKFLVHQIWAPALQFTRRWRMFWFHWDEAYNSLPRKNKWVRAASSSRLSGRCSVVGLDLGNGARGGREREW